MPIPVSSDLALHAVQHSEQFDAIGSAQQGGLLKFIEISLAWQGIVCTTHHSTLILSDHLSVLRTIDLALSFHSN